ncbi:LIM and SH3 domain protein Lasp [Galendromus occidentalis]|uniref:LIM and SH3 domain protein Lasp n=1 Tax=Galendromus occidentalis TaxID=34638 RepID=A0AAJ6VX31_9ACAR|nr:LIM and SH3 domain protein Lasp [Galendromus occidentalis]
MANKKCARCQKTVYPIEELKCLDKIWHKQCFKCQECGMVLSMNTYKGLNRLPYCNAHVPHATYTTVLDTPEARRLAENTKLQSNIRYHEDYEKSKGRVSNSLTNDQDFRKQLDNSILSLSDPFGDSEKFRTAPSENVESFYEPLSGRGGLKLYDLYGKQNTPSIPKYQTDDSVLSFGPKFNASSLGDYEIYSPMDTLRRTKSCKAPSRNLSQQQQPQQNGYAPQYQPSQVSPQYQSFNESPSRAPMQRQSSQNNMQDAQASQLPFEDDSMPKPGQSQFAAALNALKRNAPPQSFGFGNSQDPSQKLEQEASQSVQQRSSPRPQQQKPLSPAVQTSQPSIDQTFSQPTFSSTAFQQRPQHQNYSYQQQQQQHDQLLRQQRQREQQQQQQHQQQQQRQREQLFDHQRQQEQLLQQQRQQEQLLQQQRQQEQLLQQQRQQEQLLQQQRQQEQLLQQQRLQQQQQNPHAYYQRQSSQQHQQQQTRESPQQSISATKFRPSPQHGLCYIALYDYMAGDIDEVTFCEGDVIVNGDPIEGGWMIGTVLRNGQRGMLPANYVETV